MDAVRRNPHDIRAFSAKLPRFFGKSGRDAARPGEGKNSWLTGTAAWTWKAVSEFLIGIKPQYDGLLIEPCVPAGTYRVHRRFRDAEYDITIHCTGTGCSRFIPYKPGRHSVSIDL